MLSAILPFWHLWHLWPVFLHFGVSEGANGLQLVHNFGIRLGDVLRQTVTQTINARFTVNTSPFAVWHSTNMIHPSKGVVPVIVHDLAGSTLFAFRLFLSIG